MRKTVKFISISLALFMMVSCSGNNEKITEENVKTNDIESINMQLICPDGLPSIAISKILNDRGSKNLKINYSIQKTPDLLLAELMKAEADIAIVPSNLALQTHKKGLGYKIVGTIGWGSLYLVSTEDVNDISSVIGKEVYNTGQGLTPDIVFKDILKNNNISENELQFSYVGAASELAPMIISGTVRYAILPEPVLSTVQAKVKNLNVILSLNEAWIDGNGVELGYPQSTLIIKEDTYNKIKENGLYEEFIKLFTESEEWVVNNPQKVSEVCEEVGITVNKDIIEAALKNSNLVFTEIKKCTNEYEKYFSVIDENSKGEDKEYEEAFIKE